MSTTHETLLGETARWIAGVRARESRRADRLFDDPWAAALAGAAGEEWAAGIGPVGLTMLLRTRYFDDYLQRVAGEDGIRQIVLLAPGMDTRAFRLAWSPGTTLYELDQPAVFAVKEPILREAGAQPTCIRHIVGVDLIGTWTKDLAQAGFDAQQPAAWILEGFLFYLTEADVSYILDAAGSLAAPGSRLGFDVMNRAVYTSPVTRPWIEKMAASGVAWASAMDDPVAFLAARGWQGAVTSPGEPDANYGRWPLPPPSLQGPGAPRHWLVTATKL